MQTLGQDLRYTVRQLRNTPGFALTAVLTLALGLGAATAVFSVARQVLFAPLPYPQPQQLVGISFGYPDAPNADETGEAGTFLAAHNHSFAATALMHDSAAEAALSDGHGHVSNLAVQSVSQGYFQVLGVGPALGRAFTVEEDRPDGPQALVLSHATWVRRFGANPSIVGRTLRLDGQSVTVVGVMPASFRAEAYRTRNSLASPDAWRPLQVGPKDPGFVGHNYQMWGRLLPGVTLTEARAEFTTLDAALYRAYPKYNTWQDRSNQLPHVRLYPLAAVVAAEARPSLLVLAGAVAAVLLLACFNLAGLNTARALRRGPELALRAALGASRARLLRIALFETALLSIAGALGALLFARVLLPELRHGSPIPLPELAGSASHWMIAGWAALGACLSALLFGAPMAWAALRQSRPSSFRSARTAGTGRGQARAGRLLVVLQVGLAMVLLSAASLLLGTFLKLRSQPLGFVPEKLVVFQAALKSDRYDTTPATARFVDKVLGALREAPGVRSASAVNGLPLDRGVNLSSWPDARGTTVEMTEFRTVTPGYLQTMGLPLVSGRALLPSDRADTLPVAVISRATAKHWWPGRSPIGAEIHMNTKTAYRIVGVAADVPNRNLADTPHVLLYVPLAQVSDSDTKMLNGWFPITFALRLNAHVDIARLAARAVAQADPEIPMTGLATMHEVINKSMAAPRFFTSLAEAFAGFAVLLTGLGLFGLVSYQVTQQSRDIGIRMALGASRRHIFTRVLLRSGTLALAGAGMGLVGSALLNPLLSRWTLSYVIEATVQSPNLLFSGAASLAAAACLLLLASLAAAYLPARRAAFIDPMEALRTE